MKKKVLVTGGTGFLGSHICKRLIQQDINLICIDNLSSSDESNIESLKGHNNFTFIKHDVVDPIDDKFDEIYNFACPASPPQYQKDPIQTSKTSVYGAFNLLEMQKKIIHLTNSKSTIKYLDLPQDDPKQRKPDISLVKEIFNWNPKIETDERLKKTINYFRAKL